MTTTFDEDLRQIAERVRATIDDAALRPALAPPELRDAVLAYPHAGGKAMRPALVCWCGDILGGRRDRAIRAGTAIELYHTYTLVHDDIIDRDARRRGQPSVHAMMTEVGALRFNLVDEAAHYGSAMAILAGDCLQSWAISLLGTVVEFGIAPSLALRLITRLQHETGPAIVEGEARDIQLPLMPTERVTETDIMRVILTKTAALFRYCGWMGGMLARGEEDDDVLALAAYAELIGIAFQIHDDVLGLIGDEVTLGKPIGSDLREGKRTLIIATAWQTANAQERAQLSHVLGNAEATPDEIAAATKLLEGLGAIEHAQTLAHRHVDLAMRQLDRLKRYDQVERLRELAQRVIGREK